MDHMAPCFAYVLLLFIPKGISDIVQIVLVKFDSYSKKLLLELFNAIIWFSWFACVHLFTYYYNMTISDIVQIILVEFDSYFIKDLIQNSLTLSLCFLALFTFTFFHTTTTIWLFHILFLLDQYNFTPTP